MRCASALLTTALASTMAFAAAPDAGTLSPENPTLTYSSGPFVAPNASLQQDAENPSCLLPMNDCDDFALAVDLPADYVRKHPRDLISVKTQWAFNQSAYYLYLLDAAGAVIGFSIFDGDPNALSVPAAPGSYTVRIVPSTAAGDLLTTTVSLVPDQTSTASGKPPSYAALASPAGMGDNLNGEMNIGFNPKTGRALTLGYTQTLRTAFAADGSTVWEDVSEPNTQQNTNDPILFTDPVTGRTFVSQLQAGGAGDSIFYYTDDDGDSWTLTPSTINGGIDHQTVGGGAYSAAGSAGPSGSYPNAVYYCSQSIVVAFCIRSDDGGATFGAPVITKSAADCDGFLGGIHGHVKVAPDGTVYIPDRNCGGVQALLTSEDSGDTFTARRLPAFATAGANDPSLGISSDGTGYLCYLSADSHAHVAVTHDKGKTWVNDRDIGYAEGVQHAVFPVAVAGDPDRAACGFLGTTTRGNYQSADFTGVWYPFVAMTYDGGNSWHTVNVTPMDPVQGTGGICLGGTTCIENRNLLDFNDMTRDDRGRVLFGFDDGCTEDCILPPHQPTQVCIPTGGINDICLNSIAKTTIIRQTGGRTLLSAFDPPTVPPPVMTPPIVVTNPDKPSGSGLLLGGFGFYLLLPLLAAALAGCSRSPAPAISGRIATPAKTPALELSDCTNVGATFTVPVESARAALPPDFEPLISGTGPTAGATLYILGVRCGQTLLDGLAQGETTMAYAELAVTPPFEFAIEGISDYTVPLFFAATPDAVGNAVAAYQLGQAGAGTVTWEALTPAGGMVVKTTLGTTSLTLTAEMAPTPPSPIASGDFVLFGVQDLAVRSVINGASQGGESVQGLVMLESSGGPAVFQDAQPAARGFSVSGFSLKFNSKN